LLQVAFTKHGVQRHVDVDKLIRAKYQDNLEFCQWLKAFYDQTGVFRDDYDPVSVRAKGKGGNAYNQQMGKTRTLGKPVASARPTTTTRPTATSPPKVAPQRQPMTTTNRNNAAAAGPTRATVAARAASSTAKPKPTANTTAPRTTAPPVSKAPSPPVPVAPSPVPDVSQEELDELKQKNMDLELAMAEMEGKTTELEQAVLDIEKERDFYFEKLRNVELLLQIHQEKVAAAVEDSAAPVADTPEILMDKMFKILYATAEQALMVTDEGDVEVDNGSVVASPSPMTPS
jgi:microtubule-associated protein, RP/EB family